jgi:hypothetical protein
MYIIEFQKQKKLTSLSKIISGALQRRKMMLEEETFGVRKNVQELTKQIYTESEGVFLMNLVKKSA